MVQMSSTCPNGFPSDPGVSVLPRFHSRYCGHTLSRLAEIRHNKTKQTSFPTIRRVEGLERVGMQSDSFCSRDSWNFFEGAKKRAWRLKSNWVCLCAFLSKGVGWLVLCRINDASLWFTGYADLEWILATSWKQISSFKHTVFVLLLAKREGMWTYLLIAKLAARLVQLGIHRGLVKWCS
jgi:hypothetical protein